MTIITADSLTDSQTYPFLQDCPGWRIHTRPVAADLDQTDKPALRWVKDNKVCDLFIPEMDTAQFLAATGLGLSLANGPYVLSKRLSRLMRPYRYCDFFAPHELTIDHSAELSPTTWDGAGLMSSRTRDRLAASLDPDHLHYEQHLHELTHSRRFEVTVMHAGGQEKGHVVVADDLAVDFLFPAGSAKTEVTLTGRVFVGLHPVHAQDGMRLDVQSLINLHPFFRPEHLLAWLEQESHLFLQAIRAGEFDALLSRLGRFRAEDDFSQFRRWWVAEYLLSGGELMWFPGTVRAMGRQHLRRLGHNERKLRFPVPGGRYYILPDAVAPKGYHVAHGEVMLDPEHATAWVNSEDWNDHIVEVLGGCDGDDGVWVFPFTDHDGVRKVLVWRSPNQLGEYVLLEPSPESHTLTWETPMGAIRYPHMDSRHLPPRIDTVAHQYGELEQCDSPPSPATDYTIATMIPAIRQARQNSGALGAYCNILMLAKALYGRLPERLPARLEDVIDGTVKNFRNLSPVLGWVAMAAGRIVESGTPVPTALRRRIEPSLSRKQQRRLQFTTGHWIDTLVAAVANHIEAYRAGLEALAADARPPAAIFSYGNNWREAAGELRSLYARHVAGGSSREETAASCRRYLAIWRENARYVLLGAAAEALGDPALSDAVLWQTEIAPLTLGALRLAGLIGEPVWTTEGAAVYYEEPAATAVPVRFMGTWFNWLRARGHDEAYSYEAMSAVPRQIRDWAKDQIAAQAAGAFGNMTLHMRVTGEDRVVAYTEHGNLFGYVQTGQEARAIQADRWRILQARAGDGNVAAVLAPA